MPAASPPATAITPLGPVSSIATTPSPGSRSTPRLCCVISSRSRPPGPIAMATPSVAVVSGRFIAEVSKPRRAATLAAAATSASLAGSPSTRRAATKSMSPSPLRSCNIRPSSKIDSKPRGCCCGVWKVVGGKPNASQSSVPSKTSCGTFLARAVSCTLRVSNRVFTYHL